MKKLNSKGFTFVEMLAAVTIISILMILALASVSSIIEKSRQNSYAVTAKTYINSATRMINDGTYKFSDEDSALFIPISCIEVEKAGKSPYGKENFESAYVIVTFSEEQGTYNYFWTSRDTSGHGIPITASENLRGKSVVNNLAEVKTNVKVDGRDYARVMDKTTCDVKTAPLVSTSSEPVVDDPTPHGIVTMIKPGNEVNEFINRLVNNNRSNVQKFERTSTLNPAYNKDQYVVSTDDSVKKVYMWWENDGSKITWYSEDAVVYLNGNSEGLFSGFESITDLDLSQFDTSMVTNMKDMFADCHRLARLNVANLNTSNVTNMSGMFKNIPDLNILNMSSFDTSKVTDMSYMFYGCTNLHGVIFSMFNTANVRNFSYMFGNNTNAQTLDLSAWYTPNATTMKGMFSGCQNLSSLDISNFDTAKVTDFSEMFDRNSTLRSVNLTYFNTSAATNMYAMFRGMTNCGSLDLSKFRTSNVTNMASMFENNNSLSTIYAGDGFNVSNVTSSTDMFKGTASLRGGNGFHISYHWDSSIPPWGGMALDNPNINLDKTYAKINTSTVDGFFTSK